MRLECELSRGQTTWGPEGLGLETREAAGQVQLKGAEPNLLFREPPWLPRLRGWR